MTYPGGKNGGGAYQRIINYMPPHETYIEGFLGSGAVLRHKRPAKRNIGIDLDRSALELTKKLNTGYVAELWNDCFFHFIRDFKPDAQTLIYLDPPYLPSTRKSGDIYDFELTEDQHKQLLAMVNDLECMVMISGYRSYLYDEFLKGWHRIEYQAQTRRGMVIECLWMNFPEPNALHDYSHLGDGFRERERIKRKKQRWVAKLAKLDLLERLAVMDALTTSGGAT